MPSPSNTLRSTPDRPDVAADKIHQRHVKELKADPYPLYTIFSKRLIENGHNAEFPEFAPVVHKIKLELHTDEVDAACAADVALQTLRNHVDLQLASISFSKSWYPYASTLKAIYAATQFFDVKVRTEYKKAHPESSNTVHAFYHAYRYLYFFDKLLDKTPDVIIFPTYMGWGSTDMLRMFGTSIYIVGVNFKTQFVDEFSQTPAEFFIHDINHIRRFWERNNIQFDKWVPSGVAKTRDNFYRVQRECMKKLLLYITGKSTCVVKT